MLDAFSQTTEPVHVYTSGVTLSVGVLKKKIPRFTPEYITRLVSVTLENKELILMKVQPRLYKFGF